MADLDTIETYLDAKTQSELAVIPPDPGPAPVVEPLTPAALDEMLVLARNGASRSQVRKGVKINGKALTKRQVRLFFREWNERNGSATRKKGKN